jgi:hypothetical protein
MKKEKQKELSDKKEKLNKKMDEKKSQLLPSK